MLLATAPDEWSDELEALLLALKPGSTIEEIADKVRQFKLWQEAAATEPTQKRRSSTIEESGHCTGRYWLDNHHTIGRYAMLVLNPRIG